MLSCKGDTKAGQWGGRAGSQFGKTLGTGKKQSCSGFERHAWKQGKYSVTQHEHTTKHCLERLSWLRVVIRKLPKPGVTTTNYCFEPHQLTMVVIRKKNGEAGRFRFASWQEPLKDASCRREEKKRQFWLHIRKKKTNYNIELWQEACRVALTKLLAETLLLCYACWREAQLLLSFLYAVKRTPT